MQRFFLPLTLASLLGLSLDMGWTQAPGKLSADALNLARDNSIFALDLYSRLAQKDGNLFFSPYSISNALAMTYAGARDKTGEQMAGTLHFSLQPEALHRAFAELIQDLNQKRKFQLHVANALWGQKGYGFLPEFMKITRDQYGAGFQELDFLKATEDARQIINRWVENKTNDKIKELLHQGALQPDTRLVLTNAIYFKAAWLEAFPEGATKKEPFKVPQGKNVEVDMMHQHESFPYLESKTFQMVELPYEGQELSMLVFLPKAVDGLAEFEKSLTSARLDEWLKAKKLHQVDMKLPKFKMTAQFSLKGVLAEMGMPLAFSDSANFSGMTSQEKLHIDAVIHKAFVDVNEKGTEAAAATAITIRPTSIPNSPRATFHADHPFTFLIRENRTGSILFMGRVAQP